MKKQVDERIVQERRMINSSAFGITLIGLWIIIDVRLFIVGQEIKEFLDIFILTMLLSLYVLIRSIKKGHYTVETQGNNMSRSLYLGGFIGAVVFTIVQLWINNFTIEGWTDVIKYIIAFIIFFCIWVAGQLLFMRLSKKQADKY